MQIAGSNLPETVHLRSSVYDWQYSPISENPVGLYIREYARTVQDKNEDLSK